MNILKPQKIKVTDLKNDETSLVNKAIEEIGESVTLDKTETVVSDFGSLSLDTSPPIPAILVTENGGGGAVQIHTKNGDLVDRQTTGPNQPENSWLMIIKSGQNFRFLGRPTVRYFRFAR
jgi:hypothetical protein